MASGLLTGSPAGRAGSRSSESSCGRGAGGRSATAAVAPGGSPAPRAGRCGREQPAAPQRGKRRASARRAPARAGRPATPATAPGRRPPRPPEHAPRVAFPAAQAPASVATGSGIRSPLSRGGASTPRSAGGRGSASTRIAPLSPGSGAGAADGTGASPDRRGAAGAPRVARVGAGATTSSSITSSAPPRRRAGRFEQRRHARRRRCALADGTRCDTADEVPHAAPSRTSSR